MHFWSMYQTRTENVSQMTSFLPDTHSEPLLKVLHRMHQHFLWQCCNFLTNDKFELFDHAWSVLNASTHRCIVFWSGIAPRRTTLNFRRKRRWTVTTESMFLKICWTANTQCSMFQCAMATETALSELSAGSHPTSSTSPLPSTSHSKNMHFPSSTLYNVSYRYLVLVL